MSISTATAVRALGLVGKLVVHLLEPEVKGLVVSVDIQMDNSYLYHVQWGRETSTWHHEEELKCV